jgi:hypothetical protein
MIDRKRSKATGRATSHRAISRREILRIGGMVIPAAVLLPRWMTANAQTVSTSFDFYVSPTGSDSNPGTVAAPWAITSLMNRSINANNQANFNRTSGKRIGFLPGTYNVAAQMQTDAYSGAFQIDGGTAGSPTYYGSSNSSGQYSLGTATITALTSGGQPGGGFNWPNNGPILGGLCSNVPHTAGYVTIDGLRFTAYSYKGIRLGGVSAGYGPGGLVGCVIQNCEFFGQSQISGATTDNFASIWVDGMAGQGTGNFIQNNYFHDNIGVIPGGEEHLGAIFAFHCNGLTVQFNTGIKSGSFWGKDANVYGNTIAYNYIDNSGFTTKGGAGGIYDWTGAFSGAGPFSQTTNIHHNIVVAGGWALALRDAAAYLGWVSPVNVYNNTLIMVNAGGPYPAIWCAGQPAAAGKIQVYNNITTGVADGSGYKTFRTSPKALGVWDYNGYMSAASWALTSDSAGTDEGNATLGTYSSASAFASGVTSNGGISGCEAHGVSNGSPQFTGVNTGQLSSQYQLQAGSPFKGVGSTTGTASGSACDMGAWGGALPPTQIGCNFSSPSSSAVPMAPVLSTVS